MKLSKRLLAVVLAFIMVIGTASFVGAANVTFTDVSGHWAWTGGQIGYLVEKGVLNGYQQPNGTYQFKPDGNVTRAEFIKMLDETFGLTATAAVNFTDVKTSDWFYPYFAKAAAQGYILNYGSYANPNGAITREEAISLLVRYLDLPSEISASTSYFSDYSSISGNYQSYVLRAIGAGLTDGYNENGGKVFKPKGTLTRAEALTILYRAAGCIFNVNAYSRDSGAAANNNVITKGGVILNGITLNGRVIISEGATAGTVSLSGCTIPDTLYVRGTSDVTLDNCTIDNIVITGGCKLSLLNKCKVNTISVYVPSTLGIYSGVTLQTLNVEYGSNNTEVTGDGAIGKANINASGFKSSMVPSEFSIGSNLTAIFASNKYEGSSDAQASFTMTPFVTNVNGTYYLNLLSTADGSVYYYYTNSSVVPNTAAFDSYFDSSTFQGMISVEEGKVTTQKTYAASSVRDFEYIVLQLQSDGRKYSPVIIPNTDTSGNGFTTVPYLYDSTTIKFVAANAGSIYWYYSDNGTLPTQAEFLTAYAKKESELRGEASYVSGRSQSLALSSKYLKNYGYVIMMIKSASGAYYSPVVVSIGDNGFAEVPYLKTVGTIAYKASVSGEIYYYYSKKPDLPAADSFKGEYNAAEYSTRDISVSKNREGSFTYKEKYSDDYPYIIIAIKNDDGDFMQPVVVAINYKTGFRNAPEVTSKNEIQFRAEGDGTVKYYYTKDSKAPTADEFKSNYDDLPSRLTGSVDVRDSYKSISYDSDYAKDYPYMAFLFYGDDDTNYTPVLVALQGSLKTGFAFNPYIRDGKVYFKTTTSGEVWYYYTRTDDAVASSDFYDEYRDADSDFRDTISTTGKELETFKLEDLDDLKDAKLYYLVIAFTEDDNGSDTKFYYPVVLDVEDADISGSGLSVKSVDDETVTIATAIEGKLYYYFSKNDSLPSSGSRFESRYDDASYYEKGSEKCGADDEIEIDIYSEYDEGYRYLIVCLAITDSNDKEEYLDPIIVDLKEKSSSSDSELDDGHTENKTGISIEANGVDLRNSTIEYTPQYDGKVDIKLVVGKLPPMVIESGKSVKADKTYTVDYAGNISDTILDMIRDGGDMYVNIQLTSGDSIYKTYSIKVS